MLYNFVILRTDKGGRYAKKILKSIEWLNENKYPQHNFNAADFTIGEFMNYPVEFRNVMHPQNTIIHARCANPRTDWTIKLRKLQDEGFKVVNSVDAIELTSNKLACSLALQDKVAHPKSWESSTRTFGRDLRKLLDAKEFGKFIVKPYTSLSQGAYVKKFELVDNPNPVVEFDEDTINELMEGMPSGKLVIQEYIPYTALHRVIVIGGKALPYTFIDKVEFHQPGDWKVSCCLNRTTMKLNENAHPVLLDLAERTQKEVGGVINFIDIFEYKSPRDGISPMYTNAEINTACSLNIHERLAKEAGRADWNIHYRIAKQLVKELLG